MKDNLFKFLISDNYKYFAFILSLIISNSLNFKSDYKMYFIYGVLFLIFINIIFVSIYINRYIKLSEEIKNKYNNIIKDANVLMMSVITIMILFLSSFYIFIYSDELIKFNASLLLTSFFLDIFYYYKFCTIYSFINNAKNKEINND